MDRMQTARDLAVFQEAAARLLQNLESLLPEEIALISTTANRVQVEIEQSRESQWGPYSSGLDYQSMIESIQDGFISIDQNWRILYINQRAAQNGDYPPSELIGKNLWEAFPNVLGTPLEAHYRQVMQTREAAQFEMQGVIKDHWYLISVYPSRQGISIYWIDRTSHKETEKERERLLVENRHNKALLDAIFAADPSGLAVVSGPNLRFVYANPVYRFVCPDWKPVGNTYGSIWGPEPQAGYEAQVARVLETGQPFQALGFKRVFSEGDQRTFTFQARRIEWDGEPAALIILWDTTEQERNRQAVQASEARERARAAELDSLFEAMSDAVIVFDASGDPVRANRAAIEAYGFDPSVSGREIMFQKLAIRDWDGRLVDPNESPSARASKGEIVNNERYRFTSLSGREYTTEVSARPLYLPDHQQTGVVLLWRDFTAIEQAMQRQKELLEENRSQRVLLERLIEEAPIGLVLMEGPEFRIKIANPAYRKFFPGQKELVGRRPEEIFPGFAGPIKEMLARIAETGQASTSVDVPVPVDRDGEQDEAYFSAINTPIVDSAGQTTAIMGIIQDTTQQVHIRRQMEAELAERERLQQVLLESEQRARLLAATAQLHLEELEAVLGGLQEALVVVDPQLNLLRANPAAVELYGYTSEAEMRANFAALVENVEVNDAHGRPLPREEWPIFKSLQGENPSGIELHVTRKDIDKHWIGLYSASRITNRQNDLTLVFVSTVDITSVRQAKTQELEQASRLEVQRLLIQQRELERMQIARDLHDGPVQELSAATLLLQDLALDSASPGMAQKIGQIQKMIRAQAAELRAYAMELRPPALSQFGLDVTIRSHMEAYRERHPDIAVRFEARQEGALLAESIRVALFRIYQEALNNVARHASASEVAVHFEKTVDRAVLEIQDDGDGFEGPGDWLGLARQGHLGLVGMRERAEAIGGHLEITSQPGSGTLLRAVVPLGSDQP